MLIEVVIDIEQEGLYILKGKYSPQGKKRGCDILNLVDREVH